MNTGPIIYQNYSQPAASPRFSWPFFLFRLGIIILVLVIGFMLLQGVFLWFGRGQTTPFQSALPIAQPARITLTPSDVVTSINSPINLSLDYYTGQKTIQGIDVVIKYDPNILLLDEEDFFTRGSVFSQYPIIQADTQNGLIRISAIATPSQIGFNGSGHFGDLKFISRSIGQTTVDLVFSGDETTDSNLVELSTGNEILEQVQNAQVNIK